MHSPRLLVAELLRDHFPQFQPQPIGYLLGQIVVRAPAEKHDVRHVRLSDAARSREAKGGKSLFKIGNGRPTGGLWKRRESGWLMLQAGHCTGAAAGGSVSAALPTPQ